MSDQAEELSRQAAEMARRAMEIQAGHLADMRRRKSVWTVLSQPRFDGVPEIVEPANDEIHEGKKPKKDKKKKKKDKGKKAKKKNK